MLTARDALGDRAGADDDLANPFALEEGEGTTVTVRLSVAG